MAKKPKYITSQHLSDVIGALIQDDDRSFAIVSVSILDDLLKEALRTRLRPGKATELLFDWQQPLGTTSGCIRIAYALGLISEAFQKDLSTLNDIRNIFAHSILIADEDNRPTTVTFDSKVISAKCNNLSMAKSVKDSITPGNVPESTARTIYYYTAVKCMEGLLEEIEKSERQIIESPYCTD